MKDFDRNLNDEVSDFAIRVSSSLQNEFSDIEDHRRGALLLLLASKMCDGAACEMAWHCDPHDLREIAKMRSELEKQAQGLMRAMAL